MQIRIVSNDYINFFKNYLENNLSYPFDNLCFNMSFCKFYNNEYLFCVRNVIPYKQLIKKEKLYPGISEYFLKMSKYHIENNLSNMFIWNWVNYYETNIFFVGNINDKTLKIEVNKNIKPYVLISPSYSYKIPQYLENKLISKQHIITMEDFRLFFYNNIAYVYDSNINTIHQIIMYNNMLFLKKLYMGICEIKLKNNGTLIKSNEYTKIFEKNWSLYNVEKNIDKQDIEFKFIHDFEEDGLYGVNYYPIKKKCKKEKLINYPKYTFPINSLFVRFSLTSPCINNKNIYMGLGHIKINFNIQNTNKIEKVDLHFVKMALEINKKMRLKYNKQYRPHKKYIYMNFLFEYDSLNKKFMMSDFLLPIPKYDYYFSLSYLMSINKINNNIILSGGLGDYVNIMIKMTENEWKQKIKYNISNFNITNLKYMIIE
jgi:hypothetical protein